MVTSYDVAFDKLLSTFNLNGNIVFAPDFGQTDASGVGIKPHGRLRQIHLVLRNL
jgi:hypothetical protein